eukprot:scaffold90929_cov30-Tisochrysis_lutea.AAC.7
MTSRAVASLKAAAYWGASRAERTSAQVGADRMAYATPLSVRMCKSDPRTRLVAMPKSRRHQARAAESDSRQ